MRRLGGVVVLSSIAVMLLPPASASADGAVSSLIVMPRVLGSLPATGSVTLQPDPGGLPTTVLLFSSNTAVAVVPASVVADPGVSEVTFPVSPVAGAPANSFATISATTGTVTQQYLIAVNTDHQPLAFSSMAVTPSGVLGGQSATGSFTIDWGPGAPTAHTSALPPDNYLWLTSSDPSVLQVPSYASVPWGQFSNTFAVTTTAVTALTTVTVTGTWGTTQRSVTVTVAPPGIRIVNASWTQKKQKLYVSVTDYAAGAAPWVSTFPGLPLTSRGNGRFDGESTWSNRPTTITVRDNFGNSATALVVVS